MPNKVAILQTAYHWICDDCGHDNFAMPMKMEMLDEEREPLYRNFTNLQEWDSLPGGWRNFEIVGIPEQVCCGSCKTTFLTLDERADEDDSWMM